jgi:hypothetical protein
MLTLKFYFVEYFLTLTAVSLRRCFLTPLHTLSTWLAPSTSLRISLSSFLSLPPDLMTSKGEAEQKMCSTRTRFLPVARY